MSINNHIELANRNCLACEGDYPSLQASAIKIYLEQLHTSWQIIDEKKIKQTFKFKSFLEAIDFVNKIAKVAEKEGHHPDIYIFYNQVTIELWTHAIAGLSENDFIIAAKIEKIIDEIKKA